MEPKSEQRGDKHTSKTRFSKRPSKMSSAGSQNDPKWLNNASTWANLGATWPQNGPSIAKTWAQMPPLGFQMIPLGTNLGLFQTNPPQSTQNEPKMSPRCSQNAPKWKEIVPKHDPKNYPKIALLNIGIGTLWNHKDGGTHCTWYHLDMLALLGRRVEGQ